MRWIFQVFLQAECALAANVFATRWIVITCLLNKRATIIKLAVPGRAAAAAASTQVGNKHARVFGTESGRLRKLRRTRKSRHERVKGWEASSSLFSHGERASMPLHGGPLFMIRFRVVILVPGTRTREGCANPWSFQGALTVRRSNSSRFIFVELAPVPEVPSCRETLSRILCIHTCVREGGKRFLR